jgi:hypothetical protein
MRHKFITVLLLILVILVISIASVQAQDERVAILVVDDFGLRPEIIVTDEAAAETDDETGPLNCAVAIDGQDGFAWGGGASMVDIFPNPQPHGVLVYEEFRLLLNDMGGTENELPSGFLGLDWIGNSAQWAVDGGDILLISVDTYGYTTDLIADRIQEAIDSLQQTESINRFIVNMSFGLVPCEGIEELEVAAYDKIVDSDINCDDPFPNETSEPLLAALHEMKCGLQGWGDTERIFKYVEALRSIDFTNNDQLKFVRSNLPLGGQLGGLWHYYYPDELGDVTECSDFVEVLGGAWTDPTDDHPVYGLTLDALTASKDTDNVLDFYLDYDPLAQLIRRYVPDPCSDEPEPDEYPHVIFVASAGNHGKDFAYAPAYWPSVISVSARYDVSNSCMPGTWRNIVDYLEAAGGWEDTGLSSGNIAESILSPSTNSGEVIENGIAHVELLTKLGIQAPSQFPLGCLTGTSFAAPRVSIQQAVYLAPAYANVCYGTYGGSSPPLSHPRWDNLPIMEAANRYCDHFLP